VFLKSTKIIKLSFYYSVLSTRKCRNVYLIS